MQRVVGGVGSETSWHLWLERCGKRRRRKKEVEKRDVGGGADWKARQVSTKDTAQVMWVWAGGITRCTNPHDLWGECHERGCVKE